MKVARLLLTLAVCTTPFAPALCPTTAVAQQPAMETPLPCSTSVNIVRVSEIKPGMMSQFLEAVEAQKAWYKNAGLPDTIDVMRVMEQGPSTKAWKLSETTVITTHVMPTKSERPKHDAAWDAFVAKFGASSTIKNSYMTCMSSSMDGMKAKM